MIEGRKVDRTWSALDISLSISPRFYFHRIDRGMGRERERDSAENRRHCSGQQCWNSCARQEVKTASRRLSRRRRGNDIARGPSETRMLASRTLRKAKPPVRLSVCACARLSI